MSYTPVGRDRLWGLDKERALYFAGWGFTGGLAGGVLAGILTFCSGRIGSLLFGSKGASGHFNDMLFAVASVSALGFFLSLGSDFYLRGGPGFARPLLAGLILSPAAAIIAFLSAVLPEALGQGVLGGWCLGWTAAAVFISLLTGMRMPNSRLPGFAYGGFAGGFLGSFVFFIPIVASYIIFGEKNQSQLLQYSVMAISLALTGMVIAIYMMAGDRYFDDRRVVIRGTGLDEKPVREGGSDIIEIIKAEFPSLGEDGPLSSLALIAIAGQPFHRVVNIGKAIVTIGSDPTRCDLVIKGAPALLWRVSVNGLDQVVLEDFAADTSVSAESGLCAEYEEISIELI
ncbi:hypothetical protein ACFL35_14560 [Candidatus Riflebacteria bacterium]